MDTSQIDPQKWYKWQDFSKIIPDKNSFGCVVDFYRFTGDKYLQRNEDGEVSGSSLQEIVEKYTPRRIVFKDLMKETGIPKTYFDRIIKFKIIKQQFKNVSSGQRYLYILKEGISKGSLLKDLNEFYQLELFRQKSKTKNKIVHQSKCDTDASLKLKPNLLESSLERAKVVEQNELVKKTSLNIFDENRYVNVEYKALIHLYSQLHRLVYKKLGKKSTRDLEKEILRTVIITLARDEIDHNTFASLEQKINQQFNTEISISDFITEDEDNLDLDEIRDEEDDLPGRRSGSKTKSSQKIYKVK